jgi:DNA-binding HxlR family transcriptional regulator
MTTGVLALPGQQQAPFDLASLQKALAESTLNAGLKALGDRWSLAILRTAFVGVRRFDDWLTQLQIPRPTLAVRLKGMVALGIFYKRVYQEKPLRESYHLSAKGLALYDTVLMSWVWESRWGKGTLSLPNKLVHQDCGKTFTPSLACASCLQPTAQGHLRLSLDLRAHNLASAFLPQAGGRVARGARVSGVDDMAMTLGLRVDRWALLVVAAIMLGNHYFAQLGQVLQIAPSVLARRLRDMVATGLLRCDPDLLDARRQVYGLTSASRDLFGYIVCFAHWSSEYLCQRASTIVPLHEPDDHAFVPQVVCSQCLGRLKPWAVGFSYGAAP